jgi:hypothetical protein
MTDFNPDDENDLAQELPDEEELLNEEEISDESEQKQEDRLGEFSDQKNTSKDSEEDKDENELRLPDDAEADLLTILENKIRAESKVEEEEEVEDSDESSDLADEPIFMPRKTDEQHCQRCWLLVRKGAPKCPVHDDDCPIFSSSVG